MKNLLSAISSNRLNVALPEAEYKLLLSSVRDSRDSKYGDLFYETLEKVLTELKSQTDNNDAAAFQKPVSRADAPDYHLVIPHPMDLATMTKKVKSRSYKSKREFADDLSLIWDNCLAYNTGKDHYLRGCANRMRAKATKLLERITDRAERNNPAVLVNGVLPPKVNGIKLIVNGLGPKKPLKPPMSTTPLPLPVATPASVTTARTPGSQTSGQSKEVPFGERVAITRNPETMDLFRSLDAELDRYFLSSLSSTSTSPEAGPGPSSLAYKMRAAIAADEQFAQSGFVETVDDDAEDAEGEEDMEVVPVYTARDEVLAFVQEVEEGRSLKRKRSSTVERDDGRKRPKIEETDDLPASPSPVVPPGDPTDLWWDLVWTNAMLGAGVPSLRLPIAPSSSPQKKSTASRKRDRPKRAAASQGLLHYMNSNISTLKRVSRIHSKFAALQDAESGPVPALNEPETPLDERPWRPPGPVICEADAANCTRWMSSKVLQHAGFQGSSSSSLDVVTSLAGEFFSNVGRTFRFLTDKYGQTMSPEEIILHTLFESGTTHISELERYIKDDVVRYGSRLSELERKLESAYREVTAAAMGDDPQELDEDGEDLVFGNFGEDLGGEDFFGFKAMGLDKELGLASLTVPTKLWNAKRKPLAAANAGATPKEPPLPYPPPPSFVTLDSTKIEQQIGLLKPFYYEKLKALQPPPAPTAPPPPPPPVLVPIQEILLQQPMLPPPPPSDFDPFALPSMSAIPWGTPVVSEPMSIGMEDLPLPSTAPTSALPTEPVPIPDDAPQPPYTKLNPMGDVNVPGAAKKKSKGKKDEDGTGDVPPAPAPKGRPKKKKTDPPAAELEPAPTPVTVMSAGAGAPAPELPLPPVVKKKSGGGKKKAKGLDMPGQSVMVV